MPKWAAWLASSGYTNSAGWAKIVGWAKANAAALSPAQVRARQGVGQAHGACLYVGRGHGIMQPAYAPHTYVFSVGFLFGGGVGCRPRQL